MFREAHQGTSRVTGRLMVARRSGLDARSQRDRDLHAVSQKRTAQFGDSSVRREETPLVTTKRRHPLDGRRVTAGGRKGIRKR